MKKIIVANNLWQNIGNAFYMNSIMGDLRNVFGTSAEIIAGNESDKISLSKWAGRQQAYLDYSLYAKADWFVISGPIFHVNIYERFNKLFSHLKRRDTKIVLISVGSNAYNKSEIDICRAFLSEFPPYILSTRDKPTYDAYSNYAEYSYNGICSAFYSSIHFGGYDTPDLQPYIVWGFERSTEPSISFSNNNIVNSLKLNCNSMTKLNTVGLFIDNLNSYPSEIDGVRLIRPIHNPTAKASLFAYNRPNKFVSLNPYDYLNLFRNTEVTISQRVHACVPTISYQKPAQLCLNTKRSALFQRVGLSQITSRPVSLDRQILLNEHDNFIEFLSNIPL